MNNLRRPLLGELTPSEIAAYLDLIGDHKGAERYHQWDEDELEAAENPDPEAIVRALRIIDALPPEHKPHDGVPLRRALPGGWPTIGDLRAFFRESVTVRAGDLVRASADEPS